MHLQNTLQMLEERFSKYPVLIDSNTPPAFRFFSTGSGDFGLRNHKTTVRMSSLVLLTYFLFFSFLNKKDVATECIFPIDP